MGDIIKLGITDVPSIGAVPPFNVFIIHREKGHVY